jgi:hypothetical protein
MSGEGFLSLPWGTRLMKLRGAPHYTSGRGGQTSGSIYCTPVTTVVEPVPVIVFLKISPFVA